MHSITQLRVCVCVCACVCQFPVQPNLRPAFLRGLYFLFILSLHCPCFLSFLPIPPGRPQVRPAPHIAQCFVSTLNGITVETAKSLFPDGQPHRLVLKCSPCGSDKHLRRLLLLYANMRPNIALKVRLCVVQEWRYYTNIIMGFLSWMFLIFIILLAPVVRVPLLSWSL